MNLVYNTQDQIASDLINFFNDCNLNLSKPNLKMLAYSVLSMCDSESVVTANLSKAISSILSPIILNLIKEDFGDFLITNISILKIYIIY